MTREFSKLAIMAVFAVSCLSVIATPIQASLIGDEVSITFNATDSLTDFSESVSITDGADADFVFEDTSSSTSFPTIFSFFISGDLISIGVAIEGRSTRSLLQYGGPGASFIFEDLDWIGRPMSILTGVNLLNADLFENDPSTDQNSDFDVTFTNDSFRIGIDGIAFRNDGRTLDIALVTSDVPLPATFALIIAGLASLGLARRRSGRLSVNGHTNRGTIPSLCDGAVLPALDPLVIMD